MDREEKLHPKEEKPQTDRIVCEICGSCYNKKNKARHLKSRKCQQVKYVWMDRFEISR